MTMVKDLMTSNVKSCSAGDSLERAAQIMWEGDCGVVPVVDAEARPVGMITDRDICMAAYTQGKPLGAIPVSTAASKKPYTVRATESASSAEEVMRLQQIRRVPVIDDAGKLIGLLSLGDLARHSGQDVTTDEVAGTLATICQKNMPPQWTGSTPRASAR